MNTLVTGGAGFVGSHVVEALLQAGHRVVVVDNFDTFYDPESKRENLTVARRSDAFSDECVDILDAPSLNDTFRRASPEVVLHLAARPGVRESIRNPGPGAQINIQGTLKVLEAAVACGTRRLIFASSSSVYGGTTDRPSNESDHPAPLSPYAASKLCGEVLCQTYGRLHGLETICLRLFTVFGPRQRPDMAIHKFTRLILAGEPVRLFGAERSARDYTFVGDVARAFVNAAETDASAHILNVGSGRPIPLSHVICTLADALNQTPIIEHQSLPRGEAVVTWADAARAREILRFEPAVSFEEGIQAFVKWFHRPQETLTQGGCGDCE